ncbi:TolC family protein [bacterium]|nr:TolC family protein [bacterium]
MRTIQLPLSFVAILSIVLLFGVSVLHAQIVPEDSDLRLTISNALLHNPDLKTLSERIEVAKHREPQAGAWMDPMFSLGMMNLPVNSFDLNQEPMTGVWINISQTIPLSSKLDIKRTALSFQTKREQAVFTGYRATVATQIAKAWYERSYLEQAVLAIDSTIFILENLLDVTQSKYETGHGYQQELLRLETERARLREHQMELRQRARSSERQIAKLAGYQVLPADLPPPRLPADFSTLDSIAIVETMNTQNPELVKVRASRESANSMIEFAKKSKLPDLKLGAGYGFRQDGINGQERPDFFTVTAGVTLPIFAGSKQNMAVQEAVAQERSVKSSEESVKLRLIWKLADLLDEDRRHEEQLILYAEEILPLAKAALKSTTSAYASGSIDVEAFLGAEKALIDSQLRQLQHRRQRADVRVTIVEMIGGRGLLPSDDSILKENK